MENNKPKLSETNKHLSEIKWWHLLAAGMGLNLLLGNRNFTGNFIGDILVVVGGGWGLLLFIRYIKSKVVKKKQKTYKRKTYELVKRKF